MISEKDYPRNRKMSRLKRWLLCNRFGHKFTEWAEHSITKRTIRHCKMCWFHEIKDKQPESLGEGE